MSYVAIFCPRCGEHINEVDGQDDPEEQPVLLGPLYTCGWCKLQTRDWKHVVRCRATWKERQRLAQLQAEAEHAAMMRRTTARLRRMLDMLEDKVG